MRNRQIRQLLTQMQMPQFRPGMMPPPQPPPIRWMPPPQQNQGQGNPIGAMMPLMGLLGRNHMQANIAGRSPAPWGGNADTFDPGYGYSVPPPGLFGLFK